MAFVKAMRSTLGFVLATIAVGVLSFGFLSQHTYAAPGESTNRLSDQIVSYVNASCQADPINGCPGAYHEPISKAYLYVPVGPTPATVTINNVVSIDGSNNFVGNGLVSMILGAHVGGTCAPITTITNPVSGSVISTPNNVAGITQIRSPLEGPTGVTYNKFCIDVTTGPGKPYPIRENVRYRLDSPSNTLLGVYPGASTTGTGFFGGNNSPTQWSQEVAFSHPCQNELTGIGHAPTPTDTTGGRRSLVFYDLDTYPGGSPDMQIIVQKTLKQGVASPAPDGGVFGATYNVRLTGDITPSAKSGAAPNQYTFNNQGTGTSHTVNIFGEQYQSRYIYSVFISLIGGGNKIRITLPYDQVYSRILCQATAPPIPGCTDPTALNYNPAATEPGPPPCVYNGPPTPNIALICQISSGTNNATIRVRKGTMSDPNNDTMTLNVNIGSTNSTPNTRNFTNSTSGSTNLVSFNVARRAANYTVSGTVIDNQGGSANVSGSVPCPLPAPPTVTYNTINCRTFTFTIGSAENFQYDVQLQVNNANVPAPGDFLNNVSSGSHNFSATVSNYRDFNTRNFRVIVTNTSNGAISRTGANRSIGPCLSHACGVPQVRPGSVEVTQPFDIEFNLPLVAINGASSNTVGSRGVLPTYSITNVVFNGVTGVTGPTNPLPSGTLASNSSTSISNLIAGIYTAPATPDTFGISYNARVASLTIPCATAGDTFRVAELPYFKVFESDISAGGRFGTGLGSFACESGVLPTAAAGRALAFSNTDGGGNYIGSSAQFALRALGDVDNIFSRGLVPSSVQTPLTFANVGVGSDGGQLGGDHCISNYWREVQELIDGGTDPFATRANVPITSSVGADDREYARSPTSNPVRINGTGNVRGKSAIYVDGDVHIRSNIETSSTSWNSVGEIPVTYIVAKGDIFIDASVTRIDALVVALPRDDGTRGRIYTCRTPAGGLNANESSYPGLTDCSQQLVVNGGFVAKEVHLGRAFGSVSRDSTAGENPTNTSAAEVFHMSPEYFVATPPQSPIRSSLFGTDSVQDLPPIF